MECSDIFSIYHASGILELQAGNVSVARALFHKGIELSTQSTYPLQEPSLPFLMHSLGTLELNCNRFEEAKKVFTRAISLFPNQTQLLLGLASAQMRLGRFVDARVYFQESVKADPYHAQAW